MRHCANLSCCRRPRCGWLLRAPNCPGGDGAALPGRQAWTRSSTGRGGPPVGVSDALAVRIAVITWIAVARVGRPHPDRGSPEEPFGPPGVRRRGPAFHDLVWASRAENGSSRRMRGRFSARVRARATRWRCPPDSAAGFRSSSSARPTRARSSLARARQGRSPPESRARRHVAENAAPRKEKVALRHVCNAPVNALSVARLDPAPEVDMCLQAGDQPEKRGLADPGQPEQASPSPLPERQFQGVEERAGAGLGVSPNRYADGAGHAPSRPMSQKPASSSAAVRNVRHSAFQPGTSANRGPSRSSSAASTMAPIPAQTSWYSSPA